jgi:hypothetical protein
MERKHIYIIIGIIALSAIILFIFTQMQFFKVDRLEYHVYSDGAAIVTANYNLTFIEKAWLVLPPTRDGITRIIKDEYGENSEVMSITDTSTIFMIPQFAELHDTTLLTPTLNFENIRNRATSLWFIGLLNIDYSPTTTIISFENGQLHTYTEVLTIPALTQELV